MESTEMDMNEIVDGIYLGSVFATNDLNILRKLGISHILTIDIQPLKHDWLESVSYKYVYCVDMPEADILSKFEECFKFIDEALSQTGRSILIHCLAGLSRSATILAAYLMYKHQMCLEEAIGTIKEHRPRIRPNPGFMRQLELFEQMGSNMDPCNEQWRKYKLGMMADRMQSGTLEEFPTEELLANPGDASNKTDNFFKCRKCRQALFRSSGILTHSVGQGEAAFDWRSKIPGSKSAHQSEERLCTLSLFVEPVKWMADSINQLDGKLLCPKCHAKLGSFIWYGEKCPCGAWVTPAFHIQRSKVDEVVVRHVQAFPKNDKDLDSSGSQKSSVSDNSASLVQSNDNDIMGQANEGTNGVKDTILEEILRNKNEQEY